MSDPCTCDWQAPHGDPCAKRPADALPIVRVHHPHVEVRIDILAGSPIVRGTKVPVRRLWAWHRKGVTVETLVKRYASMSPAKVLDALAFAYDNQDVMDADLARERRLLDEDNRAGPDRGR